MSFRSLAFGTLLSRTWLHPAVRRPSPSIAVRTPAPRPLNSHRPRARLSRVCTYFCNGKKSRRIIFSAPRVPRRLRVSTHKYATVVRLLLQANGGGRRCTVLWRTCFASVQAYLRTSHVSIVSASTQIYKTPSSITVCRGLSTKATATPTSAALWSLVMSKMMAHPIFQLTSRTVSGLNFL